MTSVDSPPPEALGSLEQPARTGHGQQPLPTWHGRFTRSAVWAICALALGWLGIAGSLVAAPAAPGPFTFAQPDGTAIRVKLHGDEFFNWYETMDGHPVVYEEATGWWTYAQRANGKVGGSNGRRVGKERPLGAPWRPELMPAEAAELNRLRRSYRASVPTRPEARRPQRGPQGDQPAEAPVPAPTGGGSPQAPILMLLTKFSDRVNEPVKTKQQFEDLFFKTSDPAARSMANLYQQMSNGLHIPTSGPAGIQDWLVAPDTRDYYGGGEVAAGTNRETGARVAELVRWRVAEADNVMHLGPYDSDNDGFVDLACVVYQGTDQAGGGPVTDIWPIRWNLADSGLGNYQSADQNANGVPVVVRDFIVVPELSQPRPGEDKPITTIGLLCHEYGHGIGWPDFYDPPPSSAADPSSGGLGQWCLMANGSWNQFPYGGIKGDNPCWANPWLRMQSGWVTPETPAGNVPGYRIREAKSSNQLVRLTKNGAPLTEFYLLENRQRLGFDIALPGDGLLIWHVDEAVTTTNNQEWWNVSPTDQRTAFGHYLVALEQADGKFDLEKNIGAGDAQDPFLPGRTFADLTIPSSRNYAGETTDVAVRNIVADGADYLADIYVRADSGFPQVAITNPAEGLTYDYVPSIVGTASDNAGVAEVRLALRRNGSGTNEWFNWSSQDWDAAAYSPALHEQVASGTTSWFVSVPAGRITPGNYTALAQAKDTSESISGWESATFAVVEDITAPDIRFSAPAANANLSAGAPGSFTGTVENYTGTATKKFVLERLPDVDPGGRLFLNWTTNAFGAPGAFGAEHQLDQNDGTNSWTVGLNGRGLAAGRYLMWAKLYTADLRESPWQQRAFRIDYPPLVAITSPANQASLRFLSGVSGTCREPTGTGVQDGGVRLTLTDPAGRHWTGSEWSGDPATFIAPVSGSVWSFDALPAGAELPGGVYQLSAALTTNNGESAAAVAGVNQVSFRIDNLPPALAITTPAAGATISVPAPPAFTGTVSDASGVAWINTYLRRESDQAYWTGTDWSFDYENGAPEAVAAAGGQPAPTVITLTTFHSAAAGTWSCTSALPRPGIDMVAGDYTFIVLAGDHAGNYLQVDSPVSVDYHATFVWTPTYSTGWDLSGNWRSTTGAFVPRVPTEPDIASVSSGTLNLPGDRSVWALWHMGGTVTGTGTITAEQGYLSNGTMSGNVVLRLTGASTKATNSTYDMDGGTLRNEGTFTSVGDGAINLDSNSTAGAGSILNTGTWRMDGGSSYPNLYGGGSVTNHGLWHAVSGNSSIAAAFHHQAGSTLRVSANYLLLSGGGTMEPGATLDADGGYLYFQAGTHVLTGGTITGASSVYCSALSTVNVSGDVGVSNGPAAGGFGVTGGTLTGTATVSADHGYFSSGTITGGVTVRLTGASTKATNSTLDMNGGTLRNEGTFTSVAGGGINLDSNSGGGAGAIVNTGTWLLNGACSYPNLYDGGSVTNHGLWHAVSGNSSIAAAFHHKSGSTLRISAGQLLLSGGGTMEPGATLDADGGYLYFQAGTHVLAGGKITGASSVYCSALSTVNVSGDVGISNGPAAGGFGVTGGTLTGTATISADHGYFSSGTITGGVTVRLTGASTKATNSTLDMNGGTLRNEGTFTNSADGSINLDSTTGGGAGAIVNTGTWVINGTSSYPNTYDGGSITNHGLWHSASGNNSIAAAFHHRAGSSLRVSANYLLLTGGGTMEPGATIEANGGHLYFQGGSHVLSGGMITGSSSVYCSAGTVNVTGDVGAASGPATGGFGVSGGTLAGSATISADHGYFSSGTIAGGVTVRLTGASSKAGNSTLDMNGGTLRNEGTFTNVAGGGINLDHHSNAGAGAIINTGTWRMDGASSYPNTYHGGSITNHGLWHAVSGNSSIAAAFHHKAGGTLRVSANYLLLTGGGTMEPGATIEADGGHLYFQGGTHVLTGGTITGSSSVYCSVGTVNVTGDVGAPSGPASGGFGVSGGVLTGTATVSADHGYFSSGTITGSVTVRLTGASSKATNSTLDMNGGTLRNEGTFTHNGGGGFNLDETTGGGAGTIVNAGTWNILNGASFTNTYQGGQFFNEGTLTVAAGATSLNALFTNPGTLLVSGGGISLTKGSSHSGSILANGSVTLGAGSHTMAGPAALLGGTGSLSGTLTLSDGARIAPGASTGTLTAYGTLQFATGGTAPAVVIELASATAADKLALGSGALLALGNGLADLVLELSYAPLPGDTFRIVDAGTGTGSLTGRFRNAPATGAVLAAAHAGRNHYFQITYGTTGKTIDLTAISAYQAWTISHGLTGTDAGFDADPDGDGLSNGLEFVLGGQPNPANQDWNSATLAPTATVDASHLRFTFRRNREAAYLNPAAEISSTLGNDWTTAAAGDNGVAVLTTTDGFAPGLDRIEVLIPRTLAAGGRLFARLRVTE